MYTEVWHFLLVWLPLVISEECLADCSELVDVYRIIPERKPFKNALSIVKTIGYSNAFLNLLIFVECCKTSLHVPCV